LLGANCSPVTVAPDRLVPRYVKTGIVVILLVIPGALNSSVLLEIRGLVNLFAGPKSPPRQSQRYDDGA
jgi:hypothetical protein